MFIILTHCPHFCVYISILTPSKLKRENISSEKEANVTHYNIGKNIREVIIKNGGTMPEKLPTPKKSLKELEKEKQRKEKIEIK